MPKRFYRKLLTAKGFPISPAPSNARHFLRVALGEPNSVAAISYVCLVDSIAPPEVRNWRPFGAFASLRFFPSFDLARQRRPSSGLPEAVSPGLWFRFRNRLTRKRNCPPQAGHLRNLPALRLTTRNGGSVPLRLDGVRVRCWHRPQCHIGRYCPTKIVTAVRFCAWRSDPTQITQIRISPLSTRMIVLSLA
jgi:hypothetical protein